MIYLMVIDVELKSIKHFFVSLKIQTCNLLITQCPRMNEIVVHEGVKLNLEL